MTRVLPLAILLLVGLGCRRSSPEADADLADGLPWLYANYEGETDRVADMLRNLEARTYMSLDLDAGVVPRSLEPLAITEADLEGLERPDRPLDRALPMAVAYLSTFDGDEHADIVMMDSQVPVEPYSPDRYDRIFMGGEDCWADKGCEHLRTDNFLTKKNALMEVDYHMRKDFRWVDVSTDDSPRWVTIARTWIPEEAVGDNGNSTINQAYTIEFTIPRDGRGFLLAEANLLDDAEVDLDSSGGGSLRLQAIWSETTFDGIDFGDDLVKGTLRSGIDKNFDAADEFLAER